MATVLENYVTNAGDNVQQLAAAVKGQKSLKSMEESVREQATRDVEKYLRNNKDGYTYDHKGNLPWKGQLDISVKHKRSFTWDRYRKPKNIDPEFEKKIDMAFATRLFRQQLLESAQEQTDIANRNLKAMRNNFKASEEAIAILLPHSECIKDELQIAIP